MTVEKNKHYNKTGKNAKGVMCVTFELALSLKRS